MEIMETKIKAIARENGAALVGIASRERLNDAPPSADPDYLLPSTQSVISFAIPLDRRAIRDYLSKRDWLSRGTDQKLIYQKLYNISDRLVDLLKGRGFEARWVHANKSYRPEPGGTDHFSRVEIVPDFSLRYGAVAAGLGTLGWSGNLVTPQFGAAVYLGAVLTTAKLEPDPLLEESPCQRCKICTTVCPVEMISKRQTVSVTIAGREYSYAKKDNNARCIIGCGGFHGLGPNKKWSTWSPYRVDYPLPADEAELIELSRRLRRADPDRQDKPAFRTERDFCFDPNETYFDTCGNCGLVCWEKREERLENQRLLWNSGVVALNYQGRRVAVPAGETAEINTPYVVKVAVLHHEIKKAPVLVPVAGKSSAATVTDAQVMSLLGRTL